MTDKIEYQQSSALVSYPEAVDVMDERARSIRNGTARELVWLLEHPHLYTTGTSAKQTDILDPHKCPVFESGRGGQVTYHGPGQLVMYLLLDILTLQLLFVIIFMSLAVSHTEMYQKLGDSTS